MDSTASKKGPVRLGLDRTLCKRGESGYWPFSLYPYCLKGKGLSLLQQEKILINEKGGDLSGFSCLIKGEVFCPLLLLGDCVCGEGVFLISRDTRRKCVAGLSEGDYSAMLKAYGRAGRDKMVVLTGWLLGGN